MKKKLFVTLGILAAMDFIDMLAKAEVIGWFKAFRPDAAQSFNICFKKGPFRGKVIEKIANWYSNHYKNM